MKKISDCASKLNSRKLSDASTSVKKVPTAKTAGRSVAIPHDKRSPEIKSTKLKKCLNLLTIADGSTIDELMVATGWQAHSVRGFLAGTVKKKLGLNLDSHKAEDGTRRYRIVAAQG